MEFTKKDLNKTLWVKPAEMDGQRVWWKVDATGKTLGRLATDIAKKLLGKHKPYYCDFWDCGDYVVVENIENVSVSGGKELKKMYYDYSGYKGNLKTTKYIDIMKKNPERILKEAVRGMLSKNKLRDKRMKRLKLVVGTTTQYDNFKPLNLYK
ncbi:MAG: 50S ribosomal protein L13 [Candidatus Absconditabacteria bacterium]|nr:50S ribosomal protein L13 [Candidatus Absconditabacteria bacterium]